MKKTNPRFLNGVPELLVLRLVSSNEMYGYEIVQAINALTKNNLSFGEGCIYPYLHYLEKEKLVTSRQKEVSGRTRYYYQITKKGRARLEELRSEWKKVADGIALVMGGQYA
jgi:PadR family transcriptional regulator PadR